MISSQGSYFTYLSYICKDSLEKKQKQGHIHRVQGLGCGNTIFFFFATLFNQNQRYYEKVWSDKVISYAITPVEWISKILWSKQLFSFYRWEIKW